MFSIGSLFTASLSFEWNCVRFNQDLTKSFYEKYIILHQHISNCSKQREGLGDVIPLSTEGQYLEEQYDGLP